MQDLTGDQLQDIVHALRLRIEDGLARPDQEVACLPAYLRHPAGVQGRALVVDAGGTNLRCAGVELGDLGPRVIAGPLQDQLPDGRVMPVEGTEFFAFQAERIRALGLPLGLPLGYCFSYPAQVDPQGDARLLYWTKGIQVRGVEGQRVGRALRHALGVEGVVKVLNDTVAALLGGVVLAQADFQQSIGLIVGTGTNMATFLPGERLTKLSTPWQGEMAVNLESGNFSPPHLSAWDDQLDQVSDNPGRQRFEKAVSGYYLPKLLQRMLPELTWEEQATSQVVVELAPQYAEARWVLQRSADLVAASLAAVASFGSGSLAIQAEGGLFWKAPGYSERVESTLARLLGPTRRFQILRGDEVNLLGAAAAALAGIDSSSLG